MAAKTGKERAQTLRDKEKAGGIQKLVMKLTETERAWISEAQDLGGYTDHTELLLAATKSYIEKHKKAR
jgi:hypothetical protein